jgi:hypothetical protein
MESKLATVGGGYHTECCFPHWTRTRKLLQALAERLWDVAVATTGIDSGLARVNQTRPLRIASQHRTGLAPKRTDRRTREVERKRCGASAFD